MTAREPRTEGRLVRKALLESERWLTLKDNADRLAYVWLLLNVDDYANYSAERYRLMRAWRDFGITSVELVSKTLTELQDHDMIGLYEVENRPFLHIMRFHNTRQFWTRIYPKSPFAGDEDNEQKQRFNVERIKHVSDQHKQGVRGKGLGVECSGIESITTSLSGKPDINAELRKEAAGILDYLNKNTGRAYRPVETNLKLIVARLKSGATPLQLREVVFSKCEQWSRDPKMAEYLRPATLFNATKFEQYLGEITQ